MMQSPKRFVARVAAARHAPVSNSSEFAKAAKRMTVALSRIVMPPCASSGQNAERLAIRIPAKTSAAPKMIATAYKTVKKPAAAADKVADENAPPADGVPSAAPVDVAAILKARAAAKKGGRKQSDAQKAALANAKARPAQKKSGPKGRRAEGGPREKKTGKSQNDKCLP